MNLEADNATHTRGIQNYNVASEFQMSNLKSGSQQLRTIDLRGWWKDRIGQLHPLMLPIDSMFSMKILFRYG